MGTVPGKSRHPKKRKSSSKSPTSSAAAAMIQKAGRKLSTRWNDRDIAGVVSVYAADAVYLPPNHHALHGVDAIREYLRGPLVRGVSDLSFDVTFIKQSGNVAWDVGSYRMRVPENYETKREDHGKYLRVWRRIRGQWLIAADAWSSDLPSAEPAWDA
ncbi:MAG TPA: nuclear transport factor 2 family protein [Terriglobales bacterium]|jgi:uncharacterized protein (TIGR02246 family)